ncbi:MAG: hypothetical protein Q9219_004798 [cf. Caloplaca sp. 3 TL-2023]
MNRQPHGSADKDLSFSHVELPGASNATPSSSMGPPPAPTILQRRQPRKRKARSSRDDSDDVDDADLSESIAPSSSVQSSALSSSIFSSAKERKIRHASSGDACWLCGGNGRDVAHVIPKHASQDARRRQRALDHGGPLLRRNTPTAATYRQHQEDREQTLAGSRWGSYRYLIITDFGPAQGRFTMGMSAVKDWHGDPMAALYHAFQVIGDLEVDYPDELQELEMLYRNNSKMFRHLTTGDPASTSHSRNDKGDDSDDNGARKHGKNTGANSRVPGNSEHPSGASGNAGTADRSSHRRSSRLEKQGEAAARKHGQLFAPPNEKLVMLSGSTRKPTAVMQERFPCSAPSTPRSKRPRLTKKEEKAAARVGANTTAQDRIDFYCFFHGGDPVDSRATLVNKTKDSVRFEHGLLSPKKSGGIMDSSD